MCKPEQLSHHVAAFAIFTILQTRLSAWDHDMLRTTKARRVHTGQSELGGGGSDGLGLYTGVRPPLGNSLR